MKNKNRKMSFSYFDYETIKLLKKIDVTDIEIAEIFKRPYMTIRTATKNENIVKQNVDLIVKKNIVYIIKSILNKTLHTYNNIGTEVLSRDGYLIMLFEVNKIIIGISNGAIDISVLIIAKKLDQFGNNNPDNAQITKNLYYKNTEFIKGTCSQFHGTIGSDEYYNFLKEISDNINLKKNKYHKPKYKLENKTETEITKVEIESNEDKKVYMKLDYKVDQKISVMIDNVPYIFMNGNLYQEINKDKILFL